MGGDVVFHGLHVCGHALHAARQRLQAHQGGGWLGGAAQGLDQGGGKLQRLRGFQHDERHARRLGVLPARVQEGSAPGALAQWPDPDRVLIGGGGRQRAEILAAVLKRLRPGGLVVLPLATVEALAALRPLLEQAGMAVRVGQLQAWRGAALADGTRLAPLNPVLLLRGSLFNGSPPHCPP